MKFFPIVSANMLNKIKTFFIIIFYKVKAMFCVWVKRKVRQSSNIYPFF